MTKPEGNGSALSKEQRQLLDYIGDMALEMATMAERAVCPDLSEALRACSTRARDRVLQARAGVDQERT